MTDIPTNLGLEALSRLVQRADELSLEELMRATLDELEVLTCSSVGFYVVLDHDQRSLRLQGWSTQTQARHGKQTGQDARHPASAAGRWTEAVRRRRPTIYDDVDSAPPADQPGFGRALVVPVVRKGKVEAVIGLSGKPHPYDEGDATTVQRLADLSWVLVSRELARQDLESANQAAGVGLWRWYPSEHRVEWSDAFWALLGRAPGGAEPSLELWMAAVHPDDRHRLSERMGRLSETGEAMDLEWRTVWPDGSVRWLSSRCRCEKRPAGGLQSFVGITVDVSKAKGTESALRASEALFSRAFQAAPVLALILRASDGTVVNANREFCRVTGVSPHEVLGHSLVELGIVREEDQAWSADRVAREGQLRDAEVVLLARDGARLECLLYLEALEIQGERLLLATAADITRRKQAESALRENEERVRLLIEHAPAALALFDNDMRYLSVSRRWLEDYALCDRTILGKSHYEIFPEISQAWKAVHRRALAGEAVSAKEDRFVREDGSVQWLRWEVLPWYRADASIGGIVIFSEDITARKVAERETSVSRAKLAVALESISDAVFICDRDGTFLDFNEAFATFFRFRGKAECARTVAEYRDLLDVCFTSGEPAPVEQWAVPRALRGETGSNVEFFLQRKDTGERWVGSYSFAPIRDQSGTVVGAVVVARDVTEQKRAEEVLRASEEKFQRIFEAAPVLLLLTSLDTGEYLDVNSAFCEVLGFSRQAIIGRHREDFAWLLPHDAELIRAQVRSRGRITSIPITLHAADGREIQSLYSGELIKLRDKTVLLSIILDVTEMRKTESALQEASQRFRQISESAREWVWEVDADGVYTYSSPMVEPLLGYTSDELVGKHHFYDLWPEDVRATLVPLAKEAFRRRDTLQNLPNPCLHKDGRRVLIETTGFPVIDADGRLRGYRGADRDVTEREKTQAALRESEVRFRELFEHSPVAVWEEDLSAVAARFAELRARGVTDLRAYLDAHPEETGALAARLRILEVNEAGLKMLGVPSLEQLIQDLPSYFTEGALAVFREEMAELYAGKTKFESESPCRDTRGRVLELQLRLSVLPGHAEDLARVLVSFTDLTARKTAEAERRELEREVNHLQRLESLGRLASGVSHDMNNVLGAIMAIGSLLKARYQSDPTISKDAEALLNAAVRGRDLVKGLRDFSRKELQSARALDLNDILKHEAELLERTLLKRVAIVLDLEPNLTPVFGEASSIQNALMNLCVNAMDAIPEKGTLTLSSRSLGQGFVELAVQDDGEGMPPEVLAHALEPFFTTKPIGKGTGLGLSQVYGTVKSHNGTLDIKSRPGEGTRVSMVFPAMSHPGALALSGQAPLGHPSRALDILLVDDEELIRGTVLSLLDVLGHHAQAASSGIEALRRLDAGLEVDLVMLDINMPGMDGIETLSRLRIARPELKVLFATGFADERMPSILKRFPEVRILKKPFTLTELGQTLSDWS